jgi:hypothetical protein
MASCQAAIRATVHHSLLGELHRRRGRSSRPSRCGARSRARVSCSSSGSLRHPRSGDGCPAGRGAALACVARRALRARGRRRADRARLEGAGVKEVRGPQSGLTPRFWCKALITLSRRATTTPITSYPSHPNRRYSASRLRGEYSDSSPRAARQSRRTWSPQRSHQGRATASWRGGGPAEPAWYPSSGTWPSAHVCIMGVMTREACSASSPRIDRVLSPFRTSISTRL